jgi:hypothetical protein
MSSQIGGSSMHTGRPRQRVERQSANSLGSPRPKRASAIRLRAQVTSPSARKLRTLRRQNDTAIGVPFGSPPNQTDDTRKVSRGCHTGVVWQDSRPAAGELGKSDGSPQQTGGQHKWHSPCNRTADYAAQGDRASGSTPRLCPVRQLARTWYVVRRICWASSFVVGSLRQSVRKCSKPQSAMIL